MLSYLLDPIQNKEDVYRNPPRSGHVHAVCVRAGLGCFYASSDGNFGPDGVFRFDGVAVDPLQPDLVHAALHSAVHRPDRTDSFPGGLLQAPKAGREVPGHYCHHEAFRFSDHHDQFHNSGGLAVIFIFGYRAHRGFGEFHNYRNSRHPGVYTLHHAGISLRTAGC